MTDSNFVVKNGLVANGSFTANSTQFGITSAVVANTTTIAIGSATINSTVYSGTSNNANYLGGIAADSYQTEAGLSANVATLTANNTTFVGSVTAANVVSNAQLSANLANYQTTAGLSANVATMTANAAVFSNGSTFIVRGGGGSAEGGQLILGYGNNLASAITGQANNTWNIDVNATNTFRIFSVAANGTVAVPFYMYDDGTGVFNGSANNASYLGGTAASSYQLNSTLAANVAKLSANNASYLGGTAAASYITTGSTPTFDRVISSNNGLGTNYQVGDDAWIGDINLSSTVRVMGVTTGANGYIVFGNTDTTALGRAGSANLTYGGYTVLLSNNFNNYAPTLTGTGASGTWNITANNASYLGGVAAADYQTEYGLAANVATMTANAAIYATYMPTTGLGQNTISSVVPEIGNTAQWSDWPVGYTAILSGGTTRGNPDIGYGNFTKIGKDATQSGWMGLWCTADTTPQECYIGITAANTAYATWTRLLTANNFNGYAPTLTGTGASGTWNITANNAAYLGAVAANNYAKLNTASTFTANVTLAANTVLAVGNVAINTTSVSINGVPGAAPAGTQLIVNGSIYSTSATLGSTLSTGAAIAAGGNIFTEAAVLLKGNLYAGYNRDANGGASLFLTSVAGTDVQTSLTRSSGSNGTLVLRHAGTGLASILTNATSGTSGGTAAMTFASNQDVTIPNGSLAVTGGITATGNITAYYSDKRLKKDLKHITEEWRSIISGLTPYWFKWNDTALDLMRDKDTNTQIGFIAQDVQKVLPQAVTEQTATPADKVPDDGQYLTIMPEKIIPVLVSAIKDLSAEIDSLKTQLNALKGNK